MPKSAALMLRLLVAATLLGSCPSAVGAKPTCHGRHGCAPASTSPPAVSGSPEVGATLSATSGSWNGTQPIGYAYQWDRCSASGQDCGPIAGATSPTFLLSAADLGSTLVVTVIASNSVGSTAAESAPTAAVAAPPANAAPPAVSGTAVDGGTLAASPGSWTGSTPISEAYTWSRCDAAGSGCSDIAGATSSSYRLASGDVGHTLRAVVTATNAVGTATASSQPTAVVAAAPPVNTAAPTVSGSAQVGQVLTGSAGAWNGTAPITYGYQWQRCDQSGAGCASVSGATSSAYTLTAADQGSSVRVVVKASNSAGSSTAASQPSPVVTGGSTEPTLPVRAAFYYPWYPETWTVNGSYPHYHPSLGYYDSSSTAVIEQHLRAMEYGRIQVGISSWWGQQSKTDLRLQSLLATTDAVSSPVRWTIYYEPEGQGDPSVSRITADLQYIRDHYASDPAFFRIDGRFVVFVYADGQDGCAMADRWKQANTVGAYVVLKVFSGYRQCASQPDGWHQYSPASAADSQSGQSYSISPGFFKADESTPRLARDLTRWSQNIRDMIASNAPFQLVTTFDEWGEGTAVESAQEWSSASGFGSYLDALHDNGQTAADTTPPSAPTGLTVAPTQTTLAATWTGSTDNVGVAGYRVFLDGTAVATVTTTAYTAGGLSCGTTHTLAVEAFDAAGNTSSRPSVDASTTACAPPPTGPCGTTATPPAGYKHVIWVWMENKAYSDVIGSSSAPYENGLASGCGLATSYHAVTHPSLPNYIAATSGDYWGINDDNGPSSHPLSVPSLYSQLTDAGKTWRDYEESAPSNCPLSSSGEYAVKHDPAAYYTPIRTACASWDVPMGTTSSGNFLTDLQNDTLPAFAFVTPNLCNDTHDCSVATGDSWLKSWLPKIFASAAYRAGQTAVFLVWDENDGSTGNQVPLVVASPSTVPGTTAGQTFTHYSLLKTTEQMLGLGSYLGHAGDSGTASMAAAFNLLP